MSERTIPSQRTALHFQSLIAGITVASSFDRLLQEIAKMVLKIDRSTEGKCLILRLSGRMQSEHVEQLKAQMDESPQVALDLQDVKLVDRDVVNFLGACEAKGMELRHCSAYIREWITKENNTREPE